MASSKALEGERGVIWRPLEASWYRFRSGSRVTGREVAVLKNRKLQKMSQLKMKMTMKEKEEEEKQRIFHENSDCVPLCAIAGGESGRCESGGRSKRLSTIYRLLGGCLIA